MDAFEYIPGTLTFMLLGAQCLRWIDARRSQ